MSDPLDAMEAVSPTPAPPYCHISACEEPERCTACLYANMEEIREGAVQEIMQFLHSSYPEDSEVDSPDIL